MTEIFRATGSFKSFPDYDNFKAQLEASDHYSPIPVEQPYAGGVGLTEHWFKHNESDEIWRLVEPDPPFKGMWAKVE